MTMDEALDRLHTKAVEIRALSVADQVVEYPHSEWLQWFNGDYFERDQDVLEILEQFPEPLSRLDLFHLSDRVAKDGHKPQGLKQLWVMTNGWGGGKGATGYRARVNVRLALFDLRFEKTITHAVERLFHNDIIGAHEAIDPLIGAGEGFFTKFLYFVSKPGLCKPLPLIYDDQVRRALQALLGRRWAIPLGASMDWSRARIYELYVNTIHDWADELRCTPEQLELFLFLQRNAIVSNS